VSHDYTPNVPGPDQHRGGQPARAELVDRHAGVRERVADVAMFEVTGPRRYPMTCRVQLFTAAALRPVVVATQLPEEGPSLVNAAERFAAVAWQQLAPQEQEPPLVVTLLVSEDLPDGRTAAEVVDYPDLVEFTVTGPHRLADPQWRSLHPTELDRLVGVDVDLTRGQGYRPRPRDPEAVVRLDARRLVGLPRPEPFRAGCMARSAEAPGRRWRRALRRLVPWPASSAIRSCCWYHGGDWHVVSRLAVDLLEQARRRGVTEDDLVHDVLGHAASLGLETWQSEALESLFRDPMMVDDLWVNGQHRGQAMLDAGVRQTVMSHLHYPESGAPTRSNPP